MLKKGKRERREWLDKDFKTPMKFSKGGKGGGWQRAPMLIQAGERSRVEGRARLRQRRGARGGGGERLSQWPDMPRTRGRCTTAAARSQPAGHPHAWVPRRRAARGLRPGPSASDQQ